MSATELAAALGISVATVYRRLADDSPWPLDDAVRLCHFLNVPLRSMLNGEVAS
jgi:hypothetical protein